MDFHSNVCVGGPYDGRRVKVRDGRSVFVVPVPSALEVADFTANADGAATAQVPVEATIYTLSYLHCGSDRISFWVPEHQTYRDTFEKLLTGYKP